MEFQMRKINSSHNEDGIEEMAREAANNLKKINKVMKT